MWAAPLRPRCSQIMCRSRLCCCSQPGRAESSSSHPISLFIFFSSVNYDFYPVWLWSTFANAKMNAFLWNMDIIEYAIIIHIQIIKATVRLSDCFMLIWSTCCGSNAQTILCLCYWCLLGWSRHEIGSTHLPLLPLMQSQEDIFHTDAAGSRPGWDHSAPNHKTSATF